MSDLEAMKSALVNAHKAGDVAAAAKIADALASVEAHATKADPTFVDKAAGFVSDLLTGEDRTEGYPELPNKYTPGVGSTAARMSLGGDDMSKLDIYRKMQEETGAPLKKGQSGMDDHGNTWVVKDGKRHYLNAPGLSGQDAYDMGTMAAFMGPLARLGGGIGQSGGFIGRVIGTGTGTASGSVLQDIAAIPSGSQQGVSRGRAAIAGGFGMFGEAAAPVLSRIVNVFRKSPKLITHDGKYTTEGEYIIRAAGLDPDELTVDVVAELAKRARGSANPQAAGAVADAQTLPVAVPLTKGSQTLNPSDQLFENNAAAGAFGEAARVPVANAKANADAALRANIDAIRGRINPAGGGDPHTAAANVQSRLHNANRAARKGVTAAYNKARDTGAGIASTNINAVAHNVRMGSEISPIVAPKTHKLIDAFERLAGGSSKSVRAGELFRLRADLRAVSKQMDAEGVAAGNAVKSLDSELDRLIHEGLVQGDDSVVAVWKEAISSARKRFQTYQAGDIVEKLTKTEGGNSFLKIAPDKAVNVIFGRSQVFNPGVALRDLTKMRKLLGPDSAEWAQMREAAWVRLSEKALGGIGADGQRRLIGGQFAKALDRELKENGLLMHRMFSSDEIKLFRQFSRTLSRVTTPVEGGKNFSNTAPALANIVRNLLGAVFVSDGAAARWLAIPALNVIYKGGMGVKAAGSISGTAVKDTSKNIGAGGAAWGVGGRSIENRASGQK